MAARCVLIALVLLLAMRSTATGADEQSALSSGAPSLPEGQAVPAKRDLDGGDYALNFSSYEPIYFAAGWRGTQNAKFQLSFKYQFVGRFYGGYTQTSLWDLGAASAPFYDSSYRPALFYYKPDLATGLWGTSRFALQGGAEHESNGKAGADSRSINILFVRPGLTYGGGERNRLLIAPKVWVYLDKSGNPDIDNYRGYADFLVVYEFRKGFGGHKFPTGLETAVTLRKGTENNYGSVQVDVTYPFYIGYLHFQYFSGWGETLLDYNVRRPWQLRVGLMAIRW